MQYLIFAALAALLWASSTVIDKFVLSKYVKDIEALTVFAGFVQFLVAIVVLLFIPDIFTVSTQVILIMLFLGLVTFTGAMTFFKAVQFEDPSRIITLKYLSPIIVAIFSFLLLHERLSAIQMVGVVLLAISAMLISHKNHYGFKLSNGILMAVLYAFIVSVLYLISKYVIGDVNYWILYFWIAVGQAICAAFLMFSSRIRKDFFNIFKIKPKVLFTKICGDVFDALAYVAFFVSITYGLVSLSTAILALEPFFVLMLVFLISIFIPKVREEDLTQRTLQLKLIGVILVFIGVYLVTMF